MNAKQVFTAIAIAFAAGTAFASEATQFVDPPSTLTREQVKAELQAALKNGTLMSSNEATVFVDQPIMVTRSREEVREEARIAARDHSFNDLYVGAA